jgi:hypothetical protein
MDDIQLLWSFGGRTVVAKDFISGRGGLSLDMRYVTRYGGK